MTKNLNRKNCVSDGLSENTSLLCIRYISLLFIELKSGCIFPQNWQAVWEHCGEEQFPDFSVTLFSVACFSFSTLARVISRSSISFFSSEHSSSSFLFFAVSSAFVSSSSSSLSFSSLILASSWILLLMSPSHLSSASARFSLSYQNTLNVHYIYHKNDKRQLRPWVSETIPFF